MYKGRIVIYLRLVESIDIRPEYHALVRKFLENVFFHETQSHAWDCWRRPIRQLDQTLATGPRHRNTAAHGWRCGPGGIAPVRTRNKISCPKLGQWFRLRPRPQTICFQRTVQAEGVVATVPWLSTLLRAANRGKLAANSGNRYPGGVYLTDRFNGSGRRHVLKDFFPSDFRKIRINP
jgi:hypothetical protein